jgi:hypothetical protein
VKWPFWVIGGIVLVATSGYFAWQNFKISGADPSFAVSYRRSFVNGCTENVTQALTAANRTVDDMLKAKVDQVCACGADASVAEFQKDGGQTLAEMTAMMGDPAFKAKMGEIMLACRQRFGPV